MIKLNIGLNFRITTLKQLLPCSIAGGIYMSASCVIKPLKKIFKAYYTFLTSETAPFSYSLFYLAKKGKFYDEFSEDQKDFIDEIEPLNIEARYPSNKERLLKSLTYEKCLDIIEKTKALQQWIKGKL